MVVQGSTIAHVLTNMAKTEVINMSHLQEVGSHKCNPPREVFQTFRGLNLRSMITD